MERANLLNFIFLEIGRQNVLAKYHAPEWLGLTTLFFCSVRIEFRLVRR